MSIVMGIDLGTTVCCCAVYKNGSPIIIPNENGNRTTPSYISFMDDEVEIGENALTKLNNNKYQTFYDVKRFIGKLYSEIENNNYPFKIEKGSNNECLLSIEDKKLLPEQISSILLKKLKKYAEDYLGEIVTKAVITVPAYFSDSQRKSTQNAGKLAGFDVLRIINEPTAAAIAYSLDQKDNKTILIFDYGGGTLDVTVLQIMDGLFEVIATSGDTHLGGIDLDNKIINLCIEEFAKKNKLNLNDLISNKKIITKLKPICERAKIELSNSLSTNITIECLYNEIDLNITLSRARFEILCDEYFKRLLNPIDDVLKYIDKSLINDVVLIGGSTRIPYVRKLLLNYFGDIIRTEIDPDETVAIGAAIQGSILSNSNEKLHQIAIIDVIPLSLGVETKGGIMVKIIKKNSKIPCTKERVFSTYSDNQPDVSINVYEGERDVAKHNLLLGNFILENIPPMLRGEPKIIVKFHIDINGILFVQASEESTRYTKKVDVNQFRFNSLSTDKINEMKEMCKQWLDNDDKLVKQINSEEKYFNYFRSIDQKINDPYLKEKISKEDFISINKIIVESSKIKDDGMFENNKKLINDILEKNTSKTG